MSQSPAKTVLIVDDHDETREGYATYLRWAGYHTKQAADGETALVIAGEDLLPDVIVLDVRLHGMSGIAVLNELKRSAATRDIPVILVTGSDPRTIDSTTCARLLQKPVMSAALLEHVDRALTRSGGGA